MAKAYHHGELRAALVEAGLERLEREGAESLSLRALARAVGVSPMAPYAHFANRAELLAAVAAEGLRRLQRRKLDVLRDAGGDTAAALVAGAGLYVEFMLAHPHLHRLLKGPDLADRDAYPELREAAAAPAASLRELVERLAAEGGARGVAPASAAQMLWGLAHGVGELALDGQLAAGAAPALAREGARALVRAWSQGASGAGEA